MFPRGLHYASGSVARVLPLRDRRKDLLEPHPLPSQFVEEFGIGCKQERQAARDHASDAFGDFRFDNLPRDGRSYRVEVSHAEGSAFM